VKFAYADPPYLGCCSYYGHEHNEGGSRPFDGRRWNDLDAHAGLVSWLHAEYPDGWVLSLSAPSLLTFAAAHLFVRDERIGAWCKPFASLKPGINPGYCWEPVLFRGGAKARTKRGHRA
jgi:hypothetical protein